LILDLIPLSTAPFLQKSTYFTVEMSSKKYTEPEVEPQTPEEVEDVPPQDDASDPENQEQDGHQDGASGKPMTMEQRREKMRQLRAKMVRPITVCCRSIY
jgi:hypothetical protein